jgi:hypothetical protein
MFFSRLSRLGGSRRLCLGSKSAHAFCPDRTSEGLLRSGVRIETEDEIKKAEQHEVLKQMLLRLLDDPQVQRKIVTFLSRRLGQIRGE